MKKQIILFLILVILIFILGCSKDEIPFRPSERASFKVSGTIPSENGKIPSCKPGAPNKASIRVVNEQGEAFSYMDNIVLNGNRYESEGENSLPLGEYTVTNIDLTKENDTLYSIPHITDTELLHYADLKVPFILNLTGDTEITGTAFCYDDYEAPEGTLLPGIGTMRTQSMWIIIENPTCINLITVTVDYYRESEDFTLNGEIEIWGEMVYKFVVPQDYTSMTVRVYEEGNPNSVEQADFYETSPYDPTTTVDFRYDCE